jgi:hypothetical protein
MGLLQRWDRNNQETLEFHDHVEREERRGSPVFKSISAGAAIAIGIAVSVGGRVLQRALGGWSILILVSVAVACLAYSAWMYRAKKADWVERREP